MWICTLLITTTNITHRPGIVSNERGGLAYRPQWPSCIIIGWSLDEAETGYPLERHQRDDSSLPTIIHMSHELLSSSRATTLHRGTTVTEVQTTVLRVRCRPTII